MLEEFPGGSATQFRFWADLLEGIRVHAGWCVRALSGILFRAADGDTGPHASLNSFLHMICTSARRKILQREVDLRHEL